MVSVLSFFLMANIVSKNMPSWQIIVVSDHYLLTKLLIFLFSFYCLVCFFLVGCSIEFFVCWLVCCLFGFSVLFDMFVCLWDH